MGSSSRRLCSFVLFAAIGLAVVEGRVALPFLQKWIVRCYRAAADIRELLPYKFG
jgi:hypothetical protein